MLTGRKSCPLQTVFETLLFDPEEAVPRLQTRTKHSVKFLILQLCHSRSFREKITDTSTL